MTKTEQLKELRALTQAGMKDCNEALTEAAGDLQKAVDLIKTKGKNIVSGREGKIASEGAVFYDYLPSPGCRDHDLVAMVEVNCQTDFVARSPGFLQFGQLVLNELVGSTFNNVPFDHASLTIEAARHELVSTTKENCVVRRWWVEEAFADNVRLFPYVHAGERLAAVITLMATNLSDLSSTELNELGNDLAMQSAAMNPLAISRDKINPEDVARQKAIFEAQLTELKKPQAAWAKILEGKFNKWFSEVCLLEQESIVVPKTTVGKVIENLSTKLGTTINIVNMIRCQVGEGIEKPEDKLADEVSKLL